jgi:hypothetical protein
VDIRSHGALAEPVFDAVLKDAGVKLSEKGH